MMDQQEVPYALSIGTKIEYKNLNEDRPICQR